MQQYPHFLFARQPSESTQDENGSWITAPASWTLVSMCREQTNGKNTVIYGSDGLAYVFNSVVFMPKSADLSNLNDGAEIIISNTQSIDSKRVKGIVKKIDCGQLHNRLWL